MKDLIYGFISSHVNTFFKSHIESALSGHKYFFDNFPEVERIIFDKQIVFIDENDNVIQSCYDYSRHEFINLVAFWMDDEILSLMVPSYILCDGQMIFE